MTIPLPDYSQDFLLQGDAPEQVMYFVKISEAAPTTGGIPVATAFREPTTKNTTGPGSTLRQQQLPWNIPQAALPGIVPKVGDVIQVTDSTKADYGQRWTIQPGLNYESVVYKMWHLPTLKEQP